MHTIVNTLDQTRSQLTDNGNQCLDRFTSLHTSSFFVHLNCHLVAFEADHLTYEVILPTSTSSSMPTCFEPRARTTGPLIQVIFPTSLLMPVLPSTLYTLRSAEFLANGLDGFRAYCHSITFHQTHSLQCLYLLQVFRQMKTFH